MSFPAKGFQKDYVPFVDPTDACKLVRRHFEKSVAIWFAVSGRPSASTSRQ